MEFIKQGTEKDFDAYWRWVEERGPEQFSGQINRLYAFLQQNTRRKQNVGELHPYIQRVQQIRNEIGVHAKAREERRDSLRVVPAI